MPGSSARDWTQDFMHTKQELYQLSYTASYSTVWKEHLEYHHLRHGNHLRGFLPLSETPNTWVNDYLHHSQGLRAVRASHEMFRIYPREQQYGQGSCVVASAPAWEKHFHMTEKGQRFLHTLFRSSKKVPPKARGVRGQTDGVVPPLSTGLVSTGSGSSVLSFLEYLRLVTR